MDTYGVCQVFNVDVKLLTDEPNLHIQQKLHKLASKWFQNSEMNGIP